MSFILRRGPSMEANGEVGSMRWRGMPVRTSAEGGVNV